MRDWVTNVETTHYCIGSVMGPHPFPMMVRDFQRVIGVEARAQMLELTGRLPDAIVACVGGGSNAMGIFSPFIADAGVRLLGCEAGGDGIATGRHAATVAGGSVGVIHGMRTYLLQDEDGQTQTTHSISAGLDYPGVGPEHAWLHDQARAEYLPVDDAAAMAAFRILAETEGILPAIESAHAIAGALDLAATHGPRAAGAGEPLGPRRQGRRHGGPLVRAGHRRGGGRGGTVQGRRRGRGRRLVSAQHAAGRRFRRAPSRRPGRAHRLPAGRLPLDRRGAQRRSRPWSRAAGGVTSSRSGCRTPTR